MLTGDAGPGRNPGPSCQEPDAHEGPSEYLHCEDPNHQNGQG